MLGGKRRLVRRTGQGLAGLQLGDAGRAAIPLPGYGLAIPEAR
jgi:hypothetical protein